MSVKIVSTFCCGAALSLVLVLSCSDNSPTGADAASCECPLSEAPLMGRAVEIESAEVLPAANIPPLNGKVGETADCPRGSFLLSGGCAASVGATPDIVLEASYPAGTGWRCDWKNNSNEPVPVRAIARCLTPAQ
jgi:hypothetical protein